jgi:hypothetical protein
MSCTAVLADFNRSPAMRERVAAGASPRTGEGAAAANPSPSHACGVGPSLSRGAGEGLCRVR